MQFELGESPMWPRIWNNFAPFAGLMLKGFEKEVALKRASEKTDEGTEGSAATTAKVSGARRTFFHRAAHRSRSARRSTTWRAGASSRH